MSKYLIVNADDFGYSYGINKGIVDAHTNGIVTSTSVMVDAIAADEAKELPKFPGLSIGLHFELTEGVDAKAELGRQIDKFVSIVGKSPDHLDAHKPRTMDEGVREVLEGYARIHDIPLRNLNAKHIGSFGINSNDCSVSQLRRSIDEATDGYNELMTHVGYSDNYLREHSSYNDPREDELRSICSPEIRQYILSRGLQLVSWNDIQSN